MLQGWRCWQPGGRCTLQRAFAALALPLALALRRWLGRGWMALPWTARWRSASSALVCCSMQ